MTRGSDIIYTLVLKNVDLDQVEEAYVTVEQNRGDRTGDDIEVTKHGAVSYDENGVAIVASWSELDFDYEHNAIVFKLDQKDTFMFESGTAEVQIRMKSIHGGWFSTITNTIRVNPILYTKVLP